MAFSLSIERDFSVACLSHISHRVVDCLLIYHLPFTVYLTFHISVGFIFISIINRHRFCVVFSC